MEQMYDSKMKELGYDQLVCDIFAKWEDVKDEILPPDRKQGTGNGTVHVFLGAADSELRKEFPAYYENVSNGEDTAVGAVKIKHYFMVTNVLSMLGYVCRYYYSKKSDFSNIATSILRQLDTEVDESGLLTTESFFKLSIGSAKLRPYFKQFDDKGVFHKIIRPLLLPDSSYKISLFKNEEGEYAALWLIGFNYLSNFEADSNDKYTTKKDLQEKLLLQQIFYGAPGTGKSHEVKMMTNKDNSIRTTFHPDSDYSTFVGAYKPIVDERPRYGLNQKETVRLMDEDKQPLNEKTITYAFVPQAFIKAYAEAWSRYAKWQQGNGEGQPQPYYLVIEEINRGNCAQIFGDLFQLLDRCGNGLSGYAISPDNDIQRYLSETEFNPSKAQWGLQNLELTGMFVDDEGEVLSTADEIKSGRLMLLPPNLYIWATMNTSDQSLFPIDSAFKRRWEWKYMPISYKNEGWTIEIGDKKYKWVDFQRKINKKIYDIDNSEDKQLGDYFVNADRTGNVIKADTLLNKILFYIWNDVCKDEPEQIFSCEDVHGNKKAVTFSEFFCEKAGQDQKLQDFMRFNKVWAIGEDAAEAKENGNETDNEVNA